MKQTVEIFWTSGMDSTYRLLCLSEKNIKLRPVYISNANGRKSEKFELAAIGKIYSKLSQDPNLKAELLPIRIVTDNKAPTPPPEYINLFEFYPRVKSDKTRQTIGVLLAKLEEEQKGIPLLKRLWRIPIQCAPCASYANYCLNKNNIIEIGEHGASIFPVLNPNYAKYSPISIGEIDTNEIIEQGTNKDFYLLFHNIYFPLLQMTKPQIREAFQKRFSDYFPMIWWCYSPIDGKPCGKCITCIPYFKRGMGDLFTNEAKQRYENYCKINDMVPTTNE